MFLKKQIWVTEEQLEGDYLSEQATSSASSSNPWVLYEAGVIFSRSEDGSLEHNPSGERIINLRERGFSSHKSKSETSTPRYSTT